MPSNECGSDDEETDNMSSDHDDGKTYRTETAHYTYLVSVKEISLLPYIVIGVIAFAGVIYFVRRKRR